MTKMPVEDAAFDLLAKRREVKDALDCERIFADGVCRRCGYLAGKHCVVFYEEITSEYLVCGIASWRREAAKVPIRFTCIRKEVLDSYPSREEFEELYDEDER